MDISRAGGADIAAELGGAKRNTGFPAFPDPSGQLFNTPFSGSGVLTESTKRVGGAEPFSGLGDLTGRINWVGGAEAPLTDLWTSLDCSIALVWDNKPNQSCCAL